jgi:hypothetical protein
MTASPRLRRLIDLPGIADLEYQALLKRDWAEPGARAEFPEIDACSRAVFGLTADEAEAILRPAGWDDIDQRGQAAQVEAFAAEGWDVTDNRRKPLRMLDHFSTQLWLALRGVAGELPFQPDDDQPDAWGASLAGDAARFRKR